MDACTEKERINEPAATLENGVMGLIATINGMNMAHKHRTCYRSRIFPFPVSDALCLFEYTQYLESFYSSYAPFAVESTLLWSIFLIVKYQENQLILPTQVSFCFVCKRGENATNICQQAMIKVRATLVQ